MKHIFSSIVIAVLLFSCAEEVKEERRDIESELEAEAQKPLEEHKERAYYPIPSPEEMFGFINDAGLSYSQALMNPTENYQDYVSPTIQALNFGIYTADLAYCAAYEDIESTLDYYKVVKVMGADMNIEEMMTEEMMTKMQSHLQDKDSLAIIAGESYYQAVEFLESNGQVGKLALISLGGWIESIYITVNSINDFDPNSETATRLAGQKITFGNLYTYLKKHEDENGVVEQLSAIQKVRAVFGSLIEKRTVSKTNEENSKMVLNSKTKIEISENQFLELKTAINQYRNSIIKN